MNNSLYEDLGVTADASADDIKRAYKRKASASHPDKGGDVEKFKAASSAYETLSCPVRREEYDRTGNAERRADIVEERLAQLFERIIGDENFHLNLVEEARNIVMANLETCKVLSHQANIRFRLLTDQLGRIKTKRDHNLFEGILRDKIATLNTRMADLNSQRLTMIELIERLEEYQDDWG